ncbi:formylglycine-generating enzyme family protein [Methanolobus psychrotolerans]|uniref:formylglycine-generating enzyme family protein n=1 Tax=Methanolobus psychrotolerans TaxID=1874706 RepID=UPI000B91A0CB|nr:formylglycine-generating enzyme family protein [Methanolobus psychrotolerans]
MSDERIDAELEAEKKRPIVSITNSIGMEFVLIPKGEFLMGSKDWNGEKPIYKVKISKSIYMGKYPVTQREWKTLMENNPSRFKDDEKPVESVSWNDVQDFIKKLNEIEGTGKYRLPSETEWEYACRAGTITNYYFGDNASKLGEYAWYSKNSEKGTHPVGQKKPNPWGLYDMNGNVWEWCQDNFHLNNEGAPDDGSAWEDSGSIGRINRGGGWYDNSNFCQSASRYLFAPKDCNCGLGFRLLVEV